MIEYRDAYLHILHLHSFPDIKFFRCQQQQIYASPNLSGRSTGAKLQPSAFTNLRIEVA